jgi:hypothetical protein
MSEHSKHIQEVATQVRSEFLEMPGLRLTAQQAQRLWRLDESSCHEVLGSLVDERFLARTGDGSFIRDEGNS